MVVTTFNADYRIKQTSFCVFTLNLEQGIEIEGERRSADNAKALISRIV